ncbi:sigma-70 family RNA polymerase sigma factor [Olsenella sp. DSM 107455]|uniref:Sigma-70 family RNA polymerase sigma factor n=1 Tax=Thermophilibacter gallinarum TaxID=2779357 RepID=A0ABR9QSN9_9ACTN|nr:sigma-70 family RNA polymerase sigma factor [Thermophilibacter gallinarum]MBE5024104.1 sigma-70 family RNA polymerase sigma factor [Thermophilibacter gallinarum]
MTGPRNAPDRDPERLVRDYADLVLRVCYTYLRSTADAEDVCQDTLVKLLLHDEPFHDPGHERAWVIRVAANACRNLLRDRGAHPAVGLDDVPEPAAPQASGEDAHRHRDERVLAAVMALPLPQREAVYLHYYEGYPTREVARIVGATDDAVRQRLSRARAILRDDLKGDYDDVPA